MNQLGDIGRQLLTEYALAQTAVTAGAASDGAEIDGVSIDLTALASRPKSCKFAVPCKAILAQTKTLVVTANAQVSADGTNWVDITTPAVALTLTGETGGSTEYGVANVNVLDLQRNVPGTTNPVKYVRVQMTPEMSATGTDTAVIGMGVCVFGQLNNV